MSVKDDLVFDERGRKWIVFWRVHSIQEGCGGRHIEGGVMGGIRGLDGEMKEMDQWITMGGMADDVVDRP